MGCHRHKKVGWTCIHNQIGFLRRQIWEEGQESTISSDHHLVPTLSWDFIGIVYEEGWVVVWEVEIFQRWEEGPPGVVWEDLPCPQKQQKITRCYQEKPRIRSERYSFLFKCDENGFWQLRIQGLNHLNEFKILGGGHSNQIRIKLRIHISFHPQKLTLE